MTTPVWGNVHRINTVRGSMKDQVSAMTSPPARSGVLVCAKHSSSVVPVNLKGG